MPYDISKTDAETWTRAYVWQMQANIANSEEKARAPRWKRAPKNAMGLCSLCLEVQCDCKVRA